MNCLTIILILFLLLRPLLSSFFGIDVGDTGLHFTNYKYLYTRPDIVGYSTVLTSMVGNLWLRLFGSLGIWGLNFLEVIIEWATCFVVYKWLVNYYKNYIILLGLSIASIAADTYLNVFNYHQFSVLLLTCFLFAVNKAALEDSLVWSSISALIMILAIFARVSSLLCISAYLLFFLVRTHKGMNNKYIFRHAAVVAVTATVVFLAFLALLFWLGIAQAFFGSLFKLNAMASTEGSSYSASRLVRILVGGTVKSLASPLLLVGATSLFIITLQLLNRLSFFNLLLAIISIVGSMILVKFSYSVNPVDGSPQLTTGPNFFTGVLLFSAIIRLLQVRNQLEDSMVVYSSMLIMLYTLAGSNTGTKHIAISMWMLAPIAVYEYSLIVMWFLNRRNQVILSLNTIEAVIVVVFIIACPIHKLRTFFQATNNFDSTRRFEITEPVLSKNYAYMLTTQREADALNGLLLNYDCKDERIIVFGSGLGIYPLLSAEPYSRAWISDASYSLDRFTSEITNGVDNPPIVYCRTNQYFGYYSWNYDSQIELIRKTSFNGKKELLKEFIVNRKYSLSYINDYYILFTFDGDTEDGISRFELDALLG